jgi:hypothetical protein
VPLRPVASVVRSALARQELAVRWAVSAERRVPERALPEASAVMGPGAEHQQGELVGCVADPVCADRHGPVARSLADVVRSVPGAVPALRRAVSPDAEQAERGEPVYPVPAADVGAQPEAAHGELARALEPRGAAGAQEHPPVAVLAQPEARPDGPGHQAQPGVRPGGAARGWGGVRLERHWGSWREDRWEPRGDHPVRLRAVHADRLPHCLPDVPACAEAAHRHRHPGQGVRGAEADPALRALPERR